MEATGSGEGIEYLKNEPFENEEEKGQFTHKILHFASKLPRAVRWALPANYLSVHEYSRNSYPHFFTEYKFLDESDWFNLIVESRHIDYTHGMEIPDNLMNLTDEEKEIRTVVYLDILNGYPRPQPEYDLSEFTAPNANIDTPLTGPEGIVDESRPPEWTEHFSGPMIMAVKTVKMKFEWRGLQTLVEKYACETVFHDVFLDNHRALTKWIDTWSPMTIEDIRKMEHEIMEKQKEIQFEDPK